MVKVDVDRNNDELVKKIFDELPYDIIYEIYQFCPNKTIFIQKTIKHKSIKLFCNAFIITFSSYGLGLLITENYSKELIILNFFLGYVILVLSGAFIAATYLICSDPYE
jgi:hypothetical protein